MSEQAGPSPSLWVSFDPDVLVSQEEWQLCVSRGQNIRRMIANPTRPCPIPRSTLTLEDLDTRFPRGSDMGPVGALSRTNAAYIPAGYPVEDLESFSGYHLNAAATTPDGESEIFFLGQVGPRVLMLEDIHWKNGGGLANFSNHISEIALAAFSSRFPMDSLRYVYAIQVENEGTREMIDHLHTLTGPEQGFELDLNVRVWRYGTAQYLALLGTKIGRTVAYILLGAVGQGQLRISRILTWFDGPLSRWIRFDFEPIPQSGERMPRPSDPRPRTSESPREENIEATARTQAVPQTTVRAPSELSATPEGFWGNVQHLEDPVAGSSPEEGSEEEEVTLPYSEVETWVDSVRHALTSPHDASPLNPFNAEFARIPVFDGNRDTPEDIPGRLSSPSSHSSRRSRASFRYPPAIFPSMTYPRDEPEFPPLPSPGIPIYEGVPTNVSQETQVAEEAPTRPIAPSDLLFRGRERQQQPVAEEPPVQAPMALAFERWLAERGWEPQGAPTREERQELDALRAVYQMEMRLQNRSSPSPSPSGRPQAPQSTGSGSSSRSTYTPLPLPGLTETVRRRPTPEAPTPFMFTRPERREPQQANVREPAPTPFMFTRPKPRKPQQTEARRRAPTPFTLTRPEPRAPQDIPEPANQPQPTLGSEVLALGSSEPATPVPATTAAEPVVEAVPEPVVEAVPEPVVEAVPEPVAEAVPEPVAEAVPEPVAETVNEPAAETTNAEANATDNATDNAAAVAPVPTATANAEDDLEAQERGQPEGRWEAIVRLLKQIIQCLLEMFWVLIRGSGNGQTGRT